MDLRILEGPVGVVVVVALVILMNVIEHFGLILLGVGASLPLFYVAWRALVRSRRP